MKLLDVVTILLGPGNQIHGSGGGVNDWSSGNSDFGDKIRTSDIATRYRGNIIIRRIDETYLPEQALRLGRLVRSPSDSRQPQLAIDRQLFPSLTTIWAARRT